MITSADTDRGRRAATTSSDEQQVDVAIGAHPTVTADRANELGQLYGALDGITSNNLLVITGSDAVDQRSAELWSKLASVGIGTITGQGKLVFGGRTTIGPGLRTGVAFQPHSGEMTADIAIGAGYLEYAELSFSNTRTVAAGAGAARRANVPKRGDVVGGQRMAAMTPGWLNTTVTMSTVPALEIDEALIVGEDLDFEDGLELHLDPTVRHLTILAVHMTVGTGCRVTWSPATKGRPETHPAGAPGTSYDPFNETAASEMYSPYGGDGGDGRDGDTGYTGDFGPTVEIWCLDTNRLPKFELSGGTGGSGAYGSAGGPGGNGAMGARAEASVTRCTSNAGFGGNGGRGGDAGSGGRGGRGGGGGNVWLYLSDATHESVLGSGLQLDIGGGDGGPGGSPSIPGFGGFGGLAGNGNWPHCKDRPERNGTPGAMGLVGAGGVEGAAGDIGELVAVVITEAEFRDKWTDPQVRTATPNPVLVGDLVTVDGARFTRDTTVSFAGIAATTTYVADTILRATVPAVAVGSVKVLATTAAGDVSNPAYVTVTPSIGSITPTPARLGQQITINGASFGATSVVTFRGLALEPDSVAADGSSLQVTLNAPPPPFEDFGGVEIITVRDSEGVSTPPFELTLRHVVDSGFDNTRNGYQFKNGNLAGVADMSTFQETYGALEVDIQFVTNPTLTLAWYLYYRSFFNTLPAPGLSTGFSTTAADEYWAGNPDLWGDHTSITEVERLCTVAQGHVLSRQLLTVLAGQAAAGVGRARTSADEVETAFREMIDLDQESRRERAPIMQLMPAGTILTPGYITRLGVSHGLLPIRVEYPVTGEAWDKTLVLYDNATPANPGDESYVRISGTGGATTFQIDHHNAAGLFAVDPRSSASGWTLSQVPLLDCWLTDISMPLNFVFIMSPASLVVEDDAGRRFGVAGDEAWDEIPGALVAPGAPGLYLLPALAAANYHVHGTGRGVYTCGVVAGSYGASLTLIDVPVTKGSVDTIAVADRFGGVRLSAGKAKAATAVYGVFDGTAARSVRFEGARIGGGREFGWTVDRHLDELRIDAGADRYPLTVELSYADADGSASGRFDDVAVGGGDVQHLTVTDWSTLGAGSLSVTGG